MSDKLAMKCLVRQCSFGDCPFCTSTGVCTAAAHVDAEKKWMHIDDVGEGDARQPVPLLCPLRDGGSVVVRLDDVAQHIVDAERT